MVAEQIAWTKAKSQRIGLRIPITDDAAALLQSEQVYGFDRHGDTLAGMERINRPAALAALLDYNSDDAGEAKTFAKASMLCAPLVTRDGLVGVLKIAARHPGTAEAVRRGAGRALPLAGGDRHSEPASHRVAARPGADRRAEARDGRSRPQRVARREQRARVDAAADPADAGGPSRRRAGTPAVFAEDLEHVQKSLQVCRRIFGGMLTFSRNAARRSRDGQVRRAIETASAILKYGMSRSGIELHVNVPDDLPEVACSQSDLEQVFLNLLTNAREATPHGGRIAVTRAVRPIGVVEISIADTGCGIPRRESAAGARAVLHDQAARQRPRPLDLPLGSLGSRRHARRFRASPATARASTSRVPQAVAAAARAVVMKPARILVVDDEPGMLRAVERVLSEDHRRRRHAARRARRWRSPPSSIRSWRSSTSGCRIWTASS